MLFRFHHGIDIDVVGLDQRVPLLEAGELQRRVIPMSTLARDGRYHKTPSTSLLDLASPTPYLIVRASTYLEYTDRISD